MVAIDSDDELIQALLYGKQGDLMKLFLKTAPAYESASPSGK